MVRWKTYAHEANELLIAYGLVGLVNRGWAVGWATVAKTRVATSVVVPALVAVPQPAVSFATRTLIQRKKRKLKLMILLIILVLKMKKLTHLTRAADGTWSEGAGNLFGRWISSLGKAARVPAVLLPAAVALLAGLHHPVTAQRRLGLCKKHWFQFFVCLFYNFYEWTVNVSGKTHTK